ncbi:hypothetical protein QA646_23965 (plasmid) [Rhizobium sp. CB3090]|uniref:hypothetical protein n=1 Tax=Rhizobium sp. CB3090 TaxID=3039156 RepID=UPI0024B18E94|nr:hypothetical protein [Rhizobium sp. CB3090]WFU11457.1 hypothetical protein QA646_23965 [Rhizobium sp. CB3090]
MVVVMCVWSPENVKSRAEEVAEEGQKFKSRHPCHPDELAACLAVLFLHLSEVLAAGWTLRWEIA